MRNSLIIKNLYEEFSNELDAMQFPAPVSVVYNPLRYAADGLEKYLRYAEGSKRVIFVGMNPGPWGMAQTGVPFGEVNAVKNFLKLDDIHVTPPENEHELYKVRGLECPRSEVSGKRLWGLFERRFGTAENFFAENFVLNYCPLLFLASSGENRVRNLTPDKLKNSDLLPRCRSYLRRIIEILRPEFVVGIGNFAEQEAQEAGKALKGMGIKITKILHPSPASPQSNKDWAGKAEAQLIEAGVWH